MQMRKPLAIVVAALGLCVGSGLCSATTNRDSASSLPQATQEIHDRAVDAVLQGRFFEALRGFDEVLRQDPSNASAYYNRGNAHYFRHQFELALRDYTLALKYRPGFAHAAMNRGIVYSNLSKLDEALVDLDRAASLDPANSDIFYNRAVVHVKRGDLEKALADYDRIIQLDVPDSDLGAARNRLRILLTHIDRPTIAGSERNQRIISEIEHARAIEVVLDLADRSCIGSGEDHQALTALARAGRWISVPDEQLLKSSTQARKFIGGWMIQNRLGEMILLQSRSVSDSRYVCSLSGRFGDVHWFEEFATFFSGRFQTSRLVIRDLKDRLVSRQVVVRSDQARVEVVLTQDIANKAFSMGTIHGKK